MEDEFSCAFYLIVHVLFSYWLVVLSVQVELISANRRQLSLGGKEDNSSVSRSYDVVSCLSHPML